MKEKPSETFKTTEYLTFQVVRTLKDKQSLFGSNMEELTRDGRSSIKIKLRRFRIRECMNSASMSTDHSTSSQDYL
jgi:hypothetical protein